MKFHFHKEISPLSLKIKNPEIEKAYQAHIASSLQWYRIAILLGICMYFSFCIVDYFLFKTIILDFLKVRVFIVSPLIILAFLLTFWKKYPKYAQWINLTTITIGGVGIIIMGILGKDHPEISRSYAGLVPFFLYIYAFLRIRFIYASIAGTGLLIAYSIVDAFILNTPINILISSIFYMSASNTAGMFVSYLLEYQGKKEFLLQVKLEELSLKDALTGLHNRHYFNNVCKNDLQDFININITKTLTENCPNYYYTNYGLLIIDIDNFKRVNDTYGHDAGDEAINDIAKILKSSVSKTDDVIRWGGEEFLIILKSTQKNYINTLVIRIGKNIQENIFLLDNKNEVISCSIGFINIPFNEQSDIETLLKYADQALYVAKNNGKNRACEAILSNNHLEFIEINWNEKA